MAFATIGRCFLVKGGKFADRSCCCSGGDPEIVNPPDGDIGCPSCHASAWMTAYSGGNQSKAQIDAFASSAAARCTLRIGANRTFPAGSYQANMSVAGFSDWYDRIEDALLDAYNSHEESHPEETDYTLTATVRNRHATQADRTAGCLTERIACEASISVTAREHHTPYGVSCVYEAYADAGFSVGRFEGGSMGRYCVEGFCERKLEASIETSPDGLPEAGAEACNKWGVGSLLFHANANGQRGYVDAARDFDMMGPATWTPTSVLLVKITNLS